jgi:hypothetical protein
MANYGEEGMYRELRMIIQPVRQFRPQRTCAMSALGIMPVLTASVPMSPSTSSSCARIIADVTSVTIETPRVLCAVNAVYMNGEGIFTYVRTYM